jgi:hypothetical protein
MKIAQATDWKVKGLPSERTTLSLGRRFTLAEMESLRRGYVPEAMEDKWFIYWANDTLYFHRSWTGCCIYVVRFHEERGGYLMRDADVNRDREEHSGTSHDEDVAGINVLIDVLLLRRPPRKLPEDAGDKAVLNNWAHLGRASQGKHPE